MKAYVRPEVEVIFFVKEDVICTSGDVIFDGTPKERHSFIWEDNDITDLERGVKG